jgi:hypothetical protein
MRTLQLITLALLATAARADVIATTQAFQNPGGPDVSACGGGTAQGQFSAHVSFSCDPIAPGLDGLPTNFHISGIAEGDTGLGPLGIGAHIQVDAICGLCFATGLHPVGVQSSVSLDWSEEVAIEGAAGSGFVTIGFRADGGTNNGAGGIGIDLFGASYFRPSASRETNSQVTVPVQFGVPYDISVSGKMSCSDSLNDDECTLGSLFDAFVSDLTFTDANGKALSGISFVPTPEPSTLLMLATTLGLVWVARRRWATS